MSGSGIYGPYSVIKSVWVINEPYSYYRVCLRGYMDGFLTRDCAWVYMDHFFTGSVCWNIWIISLLRILRWDIWILYLVRDVCGGYMVGFLTGECMILYGTHLYGGVCIWDVWCLSEVDFYYGLCADMENAGLPL